jgi:hypothetical protein
LHDGRKKYPYMSRIIFDLPFFFTFFGKQAFTEMQIKEKTIELCEKWNMKYSGRPEVNNLDISLDTCP